MGLISGLLGSPTQCCDTSSDIKICERPIQDVPCMEEQGEMVALKPQDKYQLYLSPHSTKGCKLEIGSIMHHGNSAPVTHQALACMMPTSVSQPWLAPSSLVTYWSSDTLPHF